jgi:hypothetical protein
MRSRRKRREEVSVGRTFGRGFRWAAGGVSLGCLGGSGVAPKTIVFGNHRQIDVGVTVPLSPGAIT